MKQELEKLDAVLAAHKPEEPLHREALRVRAFTLARIGRHRDALREAAGYIQLTGSPAPGLLLFCAQQKIAIGDLEGALSDANKALGASGDAREDLAACFQFRARVLRRLGKDQAADADTEQARRLSICLLYTSRCV